MPLKIQVFWDVKVCYWVNVSRRFEGPYAGTSNVKLNHANEGTTIVRNVGTTGPATQRHATEHLPFQFCTHTALA